MRKQISTYVVVLVTCLVGSLNCFALANDKSIDWRGCDIVIEGSISHGASQRFGAELKSASRKLAGRRPTLTEGEIPAFVAETIVPKLCLSSDGGSFSEAVKIIEIILTSGGVSTYLPPNSNCLSACALIFMFGHVTAYHEDKYFRRVMHVTSRLGFHAPHIKADMSPSDTEIAERLYRDGVKAVGRLIEIDRNEFLSRSLIIEFLKMGNNQFHFVDTVFRAGAYTIEISGFTWPSVITRRMLHQACDNEENWRMLRQVREFNKNKYIEKSNQLLDQRVLTTKKQEYFKFQGYGDEGGQFCVVTLDRYTTGIGIALDILSSDQIPKKPSQRASLGVGLSEPGFGVSKPIWMLRNPKSTIIDLAAPW
jgi:hypothetical protein